VHPDVITRMAMADNTLSGDEIAKLAGFVGFKELGEPGDAVLDRFVAAGKLKFMRLGQRKYYEKDTAQKLLAARREKVPAGFVSASKYSVTRGFDKNTGMRACRTGAIKSTKLLIVGGKRAGWYCDKVELDAYLDKVHAPKPVTKPAKVKTVSSPVIDRLENLEQRLGEVCARLERILGTTNPQDPPKKADIVISAPSLARVR
jgi:hypothetical protein